MSLGSYNFKIFYRSGKLNVEVAGHIPNTMGKYMSQLHGTFNCKDQVTVKTGDQCRHTRDVSTTKGHTKGMVVNNSPKLTPND